MRVRTRTGTEHQLSYCTNIHPGESLAEVRANLGDKVCAVKALVQPDAPFGVGLRLSARVRAEPGKTVTLALEPEPGCHLETVAETIAFFDEHLLHGPDADLVQRHLGVCLDACHLAVEFERPTAAVRALRAAGIRIAKLQL